MIEGYSDYYQRIAPTFDQIRLEDDAELARTVELLSGWLEQSSKPILDVGCGTGRFVRYLSRRGYCPIGLDSSAAQLHQAVSRGPVVRGSAFALPFKTASVGTVLFVLVIHQFPQAKIQVALDEAFRVLAPGGTVAIKTCSEKDLRCRPLDKFFPTALSINLERYPSINSLRTILTVCGFCTSSVIEMSTSTLMPTARLLKSMKAKHGTTLELVPEAEFKRGYALMNEQFRRVPEVVVEHYHTLLVASKR